MSNSLLVLLELIAPFVIGIIVIIIMCLLRTSNMGNITISVPILGFSFGLPIRRIVGIRVLLIIIALGLFSVPCFKDYSTLFPNNYEMMVYYDDKGITESLKVFTREEVSQLCILDNWQKYKQDYFQNINSEVFRLYRIKNVFDPSMSLYSVGQTKFSVVPIKGWQRYYIKEAHGFLSHHSQTKSGDTLLFNTKFELLKTNNNYIGVDTYDIYIGHCKIIRPEFAQIASINVSGNKYVYDHNLTAVTKITFFPLLKISNTIYLKTDDGINYYPIGYAVYKPM